MQLGLLKTFFLYYQLVKLKEIVNSKKKTQYQKYMKPIKKHIYKKKNVRTLRILEAMSKFLD